MIAIPCLYFANHIFTWLSEPLRKQLPAGTKLIATSVVAPFMTPFKLGLLAAIFFAMPVILYQVWAFIAPGLYRHERRFALPLFVSSVILVLLRLGLRLLHRVSRDLPVLREAPRRSASSCSRT